MRTVRPWNSWCEPGTGCCYLLVICVLEGKESHLRGIQRYPVRAHRVQGKPRVGTKHAGLVGDRIRWSRLVILHGEFVQDLAENGHARMVRLNITGPLRITPDGVGKAGSTIPLIVGILWSSEWRHSVTLMRKIVLETWVFASPLAGKK
jgi:hypothetical protein